MYPIKISDRVSILYIDRGIVERDGHTVIASQDGSKITLPIGNTSVIFLGPGVSITHAAVSLCAQEKTHLIWCGENGVRVYSAGDPRGNSERIIRQSLYVSDSTKRLKVARNLYLKMFEEEAPKNRSIEQLRGIEGAKVKKIYATLSNKYQVKWIGKQDSLVNPINAALAGANAALYGITEAVILALGYSPSIGFIHSGSSRSFVYDIADVLKFKTVVPLAFELVSISSENIEPRIRKACRDLFFNQKISEQLVDLVESVFDAISDN